MQQMIRADRKGIRTEPEFVNTETYWQKGCYQNGNVASPEDDPVESEISFHHYLSEGQR